MTLLTSAVTMTLIALGAPPTPVLGAEAAPSLLPWAKALKGLDVASVPIERDRARIEFKGEDCQLHLVHGSASTCEDAVALNDTAGCWVGEGCPSAGARRRALKAAGPLTLPWRVPAGDHMVAADGGADAARASLMAACKQAAERLDVMDRDGARKALLPLLTVEALGPRDLLTVLPVLAYAGAGQAAYEASQRPGWQALDPGVRALVHVALTLGPDAVATAATAALRKETACGAVSLASAFVMSAHHLAAARLAGAIREIDSRCGQAYAVEIEAWSEVDRSAEVLTAWEAARGALGPDTAVLAPLEGIVLEAQGKTADFVARLEAAVAGGDLSPGTMKRILAFYVHEDFYEEKAALWARRIKESPEDPVASFFAGVLAHYAKDFEHSNTLLRQAAGRFAKEPRLHIYLGMNHFNLGHRAESEAAIAHAEALEVQDPDVFYCQGEIFRDSDRPRALHALKVYWHQTRWSTDANTSKQRRVWGLIQALERCIAESTEGLCDGPWEHTFASAKR